MQRSKGVTIFGWCEVALGAIGSIPSFETIRMYLVIQYKDATGYYKGFLSGLGDSISLGICQSVSIGTFPLFFVLISGILTLRLSPSIRRINTFFLPLLLIVEAVYVFQTSIHTDMLYSPFLGCMYLGIAAFQIWFFTRPKVKEQCMPF